MNTNRPPRSFRLGLSIAVDGAVADVAPIGGQMDDLPAKFADQIRQQASPLFYPPAGGALQLEIAIDFVAPRRRKAG